MINKFWSVISPFSVVIVIKVPNTNKITAKNHNQLLKPLIDVWTNPDTDKTKTVSEITKELPRKPWTRRLALNWETGNPNHYKSAKWKSNQIAAWQ